MSWTSGIKSLRVAIFVLATIAVFTLAFIFSGGETQVEAKEPGKSVSNVGGSPVTFPANGATLGAIPDRGVVGCGPPSGPARDVTFTVSGITAPLTSVELSMTLTHTWVGDVGATLIAPNGASHVVYSRTEATSADGCGDSSDLAGPYLFTDTPSCPVECVNWWDEAFFRTGTEPLTAGQYRTTAAGPNATPPAPETLMTPAFAGVTDPNGTWTLRLVDFGGGDTGTITASSLILTGTGGGGATPNGPVDYDGDGITDYAIIHNPDQGPSTQLTWYWYDSSTLELKAALWGMGIDFPISGDFDGDGKDDIAIWRPASEAVFYILESATFTARVEQFGRTGDDPSVVADYNGDGMTDIAVYREGLNPGDQSVWYYRTESEGPTTFVPWGRHGDYAAPGDYDGDGSADFVIQRDQGGLGTFWRLFANGSSDVIQFGTPNDLIVPGDYDGDGATDIAIIRTTGGVYTWWILQSSTGTGVAAQWGSLATDFPAQGDYDGDGKTDIAIYRNGHFWVFNSGSNSASVVQLGGAAGDVPVAGYNVR